MKKKLKVGDVVVVTKGGNSKKGRLFKGHKGKLLAFNKECTRVSVEGLGKMKKFRKRGDEQGSNVEKLVDVYVSVSNVMFCGNGLDKGVRLRSRLDVETGKYSRGYIDPKTHEFVKA